MEKSTMFSDKFLTRLKHAYSTVVLTGTGISSKSNIPILRGTDGLWNNKKIEEIATIETFNKNPKLFWEFYASQVQSLKNVKPNLAHYALVDLERIFKNFFIITQNIDNLHRKAGNKKIIELHGNIYIFRCTNCDEMVSGIIENIDSIPKCKNCSSLIRPNVVLNGEEVNQNLLYKFSIVG